MGQLPGAGFLSVRPLSFSPASSSGMKIGRGHHGLYRRILLPGLQSSLEAATPAQTLEWENDTDLFDS